MYHAHNLARYWYVMSAMSCLQPSSLFCHVCNDNSVYFVMSDMNMSWLEHQLCLFCHVWDYICHVCNKLLSKLSCLQCISVQMVMSATKFRLLSCLQFTDLSCFSSRIIKFNQHTLKLTYLQECILHFNFIHWIASCWLFYKSYKNFKVNNYQLFWSCLKKLTIFSIYHDLYAVFIVNPVVQCVYLVKTSEYYTAFMYISELEGNKHWWIDTILIQIQPLSYWITCNAVILVR